MTEDVKPYGAEGDPAVARVEELRALINELGMSQREAAEAIEIESRSVRRWVANDPAPPLMAVLAFRYLLAVKRGECAAGSMSSVFPGERASAVVYKKFANALASPSGPNALANDPPRPNALGRRDDK